MEEDEGVDLVWFHGKDALHLSLNLRFIRPDSFRPSFFFFSRRLPVSLRPVDYWDEDDKTKDAIEAISWYRSRIKLLLPPCPYSSLLPSTGHHKLEISVWWSSMSNWYMHRWSRHDRDICNSVMIAIRYRYFDLSINLKESPDIWSTTSTRMNWNLSGICPKFSWISDGTGNFTLI